MEGPTSDVDSTVQKQIQPHVRRAEQVQDEMLRAMSPARRLAIAGQALRDRLAT
jgi:hypothetical protein